jgi:hypothetical protein
VFSVACSKDLTAENSLCNFGVADISGCHAAESVVRESENSVHKEVLSSLR